jgi:hypothetical protein
MRVDFHKTSALAAVLVAGLCLSAAGCSLINDFAPRGASAAATSPSTTGAVEVKPAVLVQDGTQPPVTSAAPQRTANIDDLPPLPKDSATAQPSSKLLSPEEKARVIAELEALARNPGGATPTTTAKADCTATQTSGSATASQASGTSACPNPPKPALRP